MGAVDDEPGSQRIEIELTAHGSGEGRSRRGPASARHPPSAGAPTLADGLGGELAVGTGADQGSQAEIAGGGPGGERRRLVVTALVAATIALFVGWALGRSTASSSVPTADGTTATTTVAAPVPGETLPGVDPDDLPTTTQRRRSTAPIGPLRPTTTTSTERWTTTTTTVTLQAAALGIRIVATAMGGDLIELDTATGELAAIDTGMSLGYQLLLYAGADWILVGRGESTTSQLYRGRSAPQQVTTGSPWSLHRQPGSDRFWQVEEMSRIGDVVTVSEIAYDGTPTGVTFETDGRYWIAAADPAGGLVVMGAPGGTYRVGPDGSDRITPGTAIALSPSTALATDCGDSLDDCGLVVVDRAGERVTPLVPALEDDTTPYFESPANYGAGPLMSAISPDGRYSPIIVSGTDGQNFGQNFDLIDLDSGELVPLTGLPLAGLWWAPDSRSVMFVDDGRLKLFDLDARVAHEVAPDLPPITAFAVRPSV